MWQRWPQSIKISRFEIHCSAHLQLTGWIERRYNNVSAALFSVPDAEAITWRSMKLFISYSRDDKNIVYELAQRLRDDGQHDVWIDQRLYGADQWWNEIVSQIEACECFIAVLTPRAIESIYCDAELGYAAALNKPILPLLLKPTDMPAALTAIQYIDINGLSLERTLYRTDKALGEVRVRLLQNKYMPPVATLPRPPVPQAQTHVHVYEVFAAAEDAAADNDLSLATKLFDQVIKADPQGLGLSAIERKTEILLERERATAYNSIAAMIGKGNTSGARAAWRGYLQKYGGTYDPNDYASRFTAPVTPPVVQQPTAAPPQPTLQPITSASPSKPQPKQIFENNSSIQISKPQPKPAAERWFNWPIVIAIIGGIFVLLAAVVPPIINSLNAGLGITPTAIAANPTVTPSPIPTNTSTAQMTGGFQATVNSVVTQTLGFAASAITRTPTPTMTHISTATVTVMPLPSPNQPILRVTYTELNIRSGSGLNFSVIGKMKNNDTAIILGRNADSTWWAIQWNNIKGWVISNQSLSQVTGDTSNLPVY